MIGVFDSGLGGLTVVKEIFRQLPDYGVVYFGDTARTPYGNKSRETVIRYALEDARFLARHGASLIVVACNTASSVAVEALRREVRLPILEVITPAAAAAAKATSGRVGVIGTRATVGSGVYEEKLRRLVPGARVFSAACPLFVPLVEEGWAGRPETASIARRYLAPLKARRVDTLILGCTHYPFLKPVIRRAAGRGVRLVDSAQTAVAWLKEMIAGDRELADRLDPSRGKESRFFVSDRTEHFAALAARWLGREIELTEAKLE